MSSGPDESWARRYGKQVQKRGLYAETELDQNGRRFSGLHGSGECISTDLYRGLGEWHSLLLFEHALQTELSLMEAI